MKVSVIIPAWGETPYLQQTLDALARQTFRDFEVIRCEPPADERNAGAARNEGISRAGGEWLWFLDADDVPDPELLEAGVEAGEQTGAEMVVFRADELDSKTGHRTPMPYLQRIVRYANGCLRRTEELGDARFTTFGLAPWNKLVRRSVVADHRLRFQSLPRSNDLAFAVELLVCVRSFVALDRSLIGYRVNNESSLQHTNAMSPTAFVQALKDAEKRLSGRYPRAFAILREESVRYNLHSVRSVASYRELCAALGRKPGVKGLSGLSFAVVRACETLADRGPEFCIRRLMGKVFGS